MNLHSARQAAQNWVHQEAVKLDGYMGAYYAGSTIGLPDEAALPVGSDVDIMVVLRTSVPAVKLGKFRYEGVLLEVTYLEWGQLADVTGILSSYHLAGSFRLNTIIHDPSGELTKVQEAVARQWTERSWVERRCEEARLRAESVLQSIQPSSSWPQQVMGWLFGTGVLTHVLLVADLRNPTVRLRYVAVRQVLERHGYAALYEGLLDLLGCRTMTPERAGAQVEALEDTFDAAVKAAKTPFFFSSDISSAARPIAIDGSYELIKAGDHREAIFWITATFARCHLILEADAPELVLRYRPPFDALLADLGIQSSEELLRRAQQALSFIPIIETAAEQIMNANPDIKQRRR
ncbi:hypothetical protein FHS18_001180 [Paenibacillus phyllosphaerae]|uniref:Polymerase nucleotidyl transferase domain-containing protein n=1 Tax=Paenibacillus phyllosphaerae TaxID=274593 RepID=A0A7W5AUQ0_9BACL|nr:hypothetical protein [Paenibacillus phyllosphaerae]MBB3109128.1 hypothetical protein [Paenibacillus phyllosphaerae]